jgi:hypothetical protein
MKVIGSLLKIPLIAIACAIGAASVAFAADAVPAPAVDVPAMLDYWWGVIAKVISTAALIAATFPRPTTGPLLVVYQVIDFLAANFGKAKNAA